jgi:hypothetical protein
MAEIQPSKIKSLVHNDGEQPLLKVQVGWFIDCNFFYFRLHDKIYITYDLSK